MPDLPADNAMLEDTGEREAPLVPTAVLREHHPGLTHSGITTPHFFASHIPAVIFPLAAGMIFFGWRAIASAALLAAATILCVYIWRFIGMRGRQIRTSHTSWFALLLIMMMPAQLLSPHNWPLLAASGMVLGICIWMFRGLGSGRVHPVLVTYLFLFTLFPQQLTPNRVLDSAHLLQGDLLYGDSVVTAPAAEQLTRYTTGTQSLDRTWISLEALLRDRMPPLENLIIGGHPSPIGTASQFAVIVGGLLLLYRGLIDFRIPLFAFIAAYITLLVLPIPIVITEAGPQWRWLVIHNPSIGPAVALTFVHYELLAGPLAITAFFLATSPATRPITRRARMIYGILLGVLGAIFQLYVSCFIGPYVAAFILALFTPTLDRIFKPRTLI